MSVEFNYLYCDAGGGRLRGAIVFEGEVTAPLLERLRTSLDGGEFFIAEQVRVAEVFPPDWPAGAVDHCFHAFHSAVATSGEPGDVLGRSFESLVEEFERANGAGWNIFDPVERAAVPVRGYPR